MLYSAFNLECYFDLPAHVFLKDRQGVFKSCNDYHAKFIGLNAGDDIIGFTDFDFFWDYDDAYSYKVNDQKAIYQRSSMLVIESGKIAQNQRKNFLSYKIPLSNSNGKILGTIGICTMLDTDLMIIESMLQLESRLGSNLNHDERLLTLKQEECLYYFAIGMQVKEIAKAMNLSPRTIEKHIMVIKDKFHCTTRSGLFIKALSMPTIKNRILQNCFNIK